MKIGIFTDSHYSSKALTCKKRYNSKSLEKIKHAYRFFEKENCDLVICLGDLTDKEATHEEEIRNLTELAKVINESPLKTVSLMGNHDAFAFSQEEFYKILGLEKPEVMEADHKTLLFLDGCYFKNGNRYMPGDTDWKDTFYPYTQDLKNQLAKATGDVYVFVHQNLDPDVRGDHRLHNVEEINRILRESGKVKSVYQGHYHPGRQGIQGKIRYVTFPAMCENEFACFIEKI